MQIFIHIQHETQKIIYIQIQTQKTKTIHIQHETQRLQIFTFNMKHIYHKYSHST